MGLVVPLPEEVGEGFKGFRLGMVKGAAGDSQEFDQVFRAAPVEVALGKEQEGTPAFFEGVRAAIRLESIHGALEDFPQCQAAPGWGGLVVILLAVGFDQGDLGKRKFSHPAGTLPGFESLVDGLAGDRLVGTHGKTRELSGGRFSAVFGQIRGRGGKSVPLY